MDIDVDNELLSILAAGDLIEQRAWPALRSDMLVRLDRIAKNDFPIPDLPPPSRHHLSDMRPASPPLSPPPDQPVPDADGGDGDGDGDGRGGGGEIAIPSAEQSAEPAPLPRQIDDMLVAIKRKIETFDAYPPHTIQRLAELILSPTAHYRALASWLHAVDRTVQVTSGTDTYPLPPPIPDMSSMRINGESDAGRDPAAQISWANPTTTAAATAVAVGSDEALGGALLTPIPWLTRRSPEAAVLPAAAGGSSSSSSSSSSAAAAAAAGPSSSSNGAGASAHGAQIHSEGTQTIDGPNGMGSIETVSVSVNGVHSMGHSRGVTQGELLRQEQRAGVVPVSQLARHARALDEQGTRMDEDRERRSARGRGRRVGAGAAEEGEEGEEGDEEDEQDEEHEVPHARGPEEIGVGDTGPQSASTSLVGESGGIEMRGIDVEAAVGRRRPDNDRAGARGDAEGEGRDWARHGSPGAESTSSKREAEDELGDLAPKKVKEDTTMGDGEEGNKVMTEEPQTQEQKAEADVMDSADQQQKEQQQQQQQQDEEPPAAEDKMEMEMDMET